MKYGRDGINYENIKNDCWMDFDFLYFINWGSVINMHMQINCQCWYLWGHSCNALSTFWSCGLWFVFWASMVLYLSFEGGYLNVGENY